MGQWVGCTVVYGLCNVLVEVKALELDAPPCGACTRLQTAIDKQLQFPSLCPIYDNNMQYVGTDCTTVYTVRQSTK